ncbi:MAG: DUF3149 domain-containing protein [Betaproteobacteria bacterium]|nr:DUF3149 domain-containing protein [Betaproteobacteria bacterium]
MGIFLDMFTSLIGLLSLFTIGFCVVMGVYLMRYFQNRMVEDERNASKQQRNA